VGSGSTSGVGTDDSETFRLGNWESEVVGGACGAADRGEKVRMERLWNLYRVNLLDCVGAEYRARRGNMLQNTPGPHYQQGTVQV